MEIGSRGKRGFTLVEVLVASVLSLTVLALGGVILVTARHMATASGSSFLISRDLSLGAEQLRKDLRETALGAIRVESGSQPSVTMVTASAADGKIVIDAQGTPDWQGWAHYVLEKGKEPQTGTLSKWMEYPADPMPYPLVSMTASNPVPKSVKKVSVLANVVFPNQVLTDDQGKAMTLSDSDGFSVRFVHLDKSNDYLANDINPAVTSASPDEIDGNTRLVEVRLRTFTKSSTGKVDTVGMHFRVCPRY